MKRGCAIIFWLALIIIGCQTNSSSEQENGIVFPGTGVGKADVFGRALAGVAAPYEADLQLSLREVELESNMVRRRTVGWEIAFRTLDNVPLLGLANTLESSDEEIQLESGVVPEVPRWQTWYGSDEIKRMFTYLLEQMTPEERTLRRAFTEEELDLAFQWNATALDRSERWPLERFFSHVEKMSACPDTISPADCAITMQSNFSGGTSGNSRVTYAPSTARHLLRNYGRLLDCEDMMNAFPMDAFNQTNDENFSNCFDAEFPADSVLIKAHWSRAEFGRQVEVHDTTAEGLSTVIGPGASAHWAEGEYTADPPPERIFTISLKNGDIYRLTGFHIMTKELRHWTWVTLWWSDTPLSDFGADRPALPASVDPVWGNYKMGIVVDYTEKDPSPSGHYRETHPSLAASLATTEGPLTWLSNPYIEHGRGNARTNCIGCHQHGGAVNGPDLDGDGTEDLLNLDMIIDSPNLFPENGRTQMRKTFPADYLWSTQRVDNIAQTFRSEISNFDFLDKQDPLVRAKGISTLQGDEENGGLLYDSNCRTCHTGELTGSETVANLFNVVPLITDEAFARVLLTGKGGMPSWSDLSDQDLADIIAFVNARTSSGEPEKDVEQAQE